MKNFKKLMLGCALTVMVLGGTAAANNQTANRKTENHRIIGTVISINRLERTMEVEDRATNRIYKVKVPLNTELKLSKSSALASYQSDVNFERVMQGLILDLQVNN